MGLFLTTFSKMVGFIFESEFASGKNLVVDKISSAVEKCASKVS